MATTRPYLDMITQAPGINANTVLHQGQPCKLCGGFSPPFDSVDFFKYCSPTDPFAFGFAGIHVGLSALPVTAASSSPTSSTTGRRKNSPPTSTTPTMRGSTRNTPTSGPPTSPRMVAERLGTLRDIDILDYGSGSGAFAERMAAHGFANITNYDPFSSPARPDGKFSLITCFEVIEHTVSPRACLEDMASVPRTRRLHRFLPAAAAADIETIRGSWWYIGPRNGHASIFTGDALARLAAGCGLVFHRATGCTASRRETPPRPRAASWQRSVAPYASVRLDAPLDAGVAAPARAQQMDAWHEPRTRRRLPLPMDAQDRASPGTACCRRSIRCGCASPCRSTIRSATASPRSAAIDVGAGQFLPLRCRHRTGRRDDDRRPVENLVTLHTPDPVSPRACAAWTDDRPLGLAIAVYPWVPPDMFG